MQKIDGSYPKYVTDLFFFLRMTCVHTVNVVSFHFMFSL